MAYRILFFSEPCKLSLKDNAIIVQRAEQKPVSVPLEDVDVVVLESLCGTISTALLSQIAKRNIALVVCDEAHMPNGILYHIGANCRHSEVARRQISTSEELKKDVWKELLQQKLSNQAKVLEFAGHKKESEKIFGYAKNLENPYIEGYAASLYFGKLFPNMLRRNEIALDARDSALNYGYAILRAIIARNIAVSGLLPAFGVFHDSVLNPFNLADDLIEPFRPLVDKIVFEMFRAEKDYEFFLQRAHKTKILEILQSECVIAGKMYKIPDAIEVLCGSLVKKFFDDTKILKLPEFP